jgi:TM2 domain-containing membrane protein YozV
MRGSGGRQVLIVLIFGLMCASLFFVTASGAGRFYTDRPIDGARIALGAALFAVAAVIGFAARAARPEWSRSEGLTWAGGIVILIVALAAAIAGVIVAPD